MASIRSEPHCNDRCRSHEKEHPLSGLALPQR